jgi:hypothetical protein
MWVYTHTHIPIPLYFYLPDDGSEEAETCRTYGNVITSAGFVPAILEREQPQTHALDRAAIGIGCINTGQCISLDCNK